MKALWIWLFLAGGAGALCRYALGGWVQSLTGVTFPWGTFVVNIAGALIFGFVAELAGERGLIPPEARIVVLAGFAGAFTTFSTLAFETTGLLQDREWLLAAGNYLGQGVAGIAAILAGVALARLI
jgi:CrcB protein